MEQPPRNLNAYRVADLRELAGTLGLPTGGTKAELIARIQDYYRTGAPRPITTPTATPTATHPERRRQNPFETINDIAGILGAVLTGRVRFEDVKEQLRRELGTYSIVDFKNVYEVMGLTRPRQATKANYIEKLMTYLETYTPPRGAPTLAPAPAPTPKAPAPTLTPTRVPAPTPQIPTVINNYIDLLMTNPQYILDPGPQHFLSQDLNTLSIEQLRDLLMNRFRLAVRPDETKEQLIDAFINELRARAGVAAPPQPTTPLGTIDPALARNYFREFITDPTFILTLGEERVLRRRLGQLSLEQLRALAQDRFGYTTSPYDTKESIINWVINTTYAKAKEDPIALRRRLEQLSIEQVRALAKDQFGYTPGPYDTKEVIINAIINRINDQQQGIDPFISEYIDEFIQDPAKLATTGGRDAFRGTVRQLTEPQLRYILQSRLGYTAPPGVDKDNLISIMIDMIRARAPGAPTPTVPGVTPTPISPATREYVSRVIANPNVLNDPRQEAILREHLSDLTVPQLRAVSQELLNLTPLPNATKEQLVGLIIDTIKTFGGRVPPIPGVPTPAPAPTTIPPGILDAIDILIASPNLIHSPGREALLREWMTDLTVPQLRSISQELLKITPPPNATKEQLVDLIVDTLKTLGGRVPPIPAPIPAPTPTGGPTDLLDRLIANPQLVTTPHMIGDIYDAMNDMTLDEIRTYFRSKQVPLDIARTVSKKEIADQFIDYVRKLATGAITRPPTVPPTAIVPPIPQETQDVINTLIRYPQRIDQADVRYLLENRLRQLSSEQLRLILQEKFAVTAPANVVNEQLVASIVENIRARIPTRAPPTPAVPKVTPTPAKPAPTPAETPTQLLDRVLANPQLILQPDIPLLIRQNIPLLSIPELRTYMTTKQLPVRVARGTSKAEIADAFIDYVRQQATVTAIGGERPPPTLPAQHPLLDSIRQKLRDNPLRALPEIRNMTVSRRAEITPANIANMIRNGNYISQDGPLSYYSTTYPIESIMAEGDEFATRVLDQLEYRNFIRPTNTEFESAYDNKLAFLRLLELYRVNDVLTAPERDLILSLSTPDLRQLLGPTYNGPLDRASVLWALIKRRNPPPARATEDPRYAMILQLDPRIVMRLAVDIHNYFGTTHQPMSEYSPYRHLLVYPESVLDVFVTTYNGDTQAFANQIGMIIPEGAQRTAEKYYFRNLRKYIYVFSRPENTPAPPQLDPEAPRDRNKRRIRIYTDVELVDAYDVEPPYNWVSRSDLIARILDDAETYARGSQWSFRKRNCNNDETINIVSGDFRDKNDPNDPILSYGTMTNYRCYNLDELMVSFRNTETGFVFAVPDWKAGEEMSLFPLASIRQLRTLLQNTHNALYKPLLDKITEGFAQMNQAGARLRGLRTQYLAFTPEQQQLVRDYLAWMFLLSATFRFWKGPPNRYPMVWVEGGGRNELCTEIQRDANAVYWMALRTRILSAMPKTLEQWVLSLPRVKYNFSTGDATLGEETIDFVITKAQEGNFCLADASDRIIQTAYYLTTRLLSLDNDQFNQLMKDEMMHIYIQYELPSLSTLLDGAITQLQGRTTPDTLKLIISNVNRVRQKLGLIPPISDREPQPALLQIARGMRATFPRLQQTAITEMQAKVGQQPDFRPGDVTRTYHTDPNIRLVDVATEAED